MALVVKNPLANEEDRYGFHPGWGKSPAAGHDKPTPVFLPGESHEQRSLVCYTPWSCKEPTLLKPLSTHNNTLS